jgi:hypothetical protein
MRDELRKIIDPVDGGRMFCYDKRGTSHRKTPKAAWATWEGCELCDKKPCACNGILPEASMIQTFISYKAQQKKKHKAA